MRPIGQRQGMSDPCCVALPGEREQPRTTGTALPEFHRHPLSIETQVRHRDGAAGYSGARALCKTPDSHDAAVTVRRVQEASTRAKRKGLANKLEGVAGVEGKDDFVLVRVGTEVLEHPSAAGFF